MVTVASAQPHAGPGSRIISLSLSCRQPFIGYIPVSRGLISLPLPPHPHSSSVSDSRATTPRVSPLSLLLAGSRILIYSRQPRANRRNDNWQRAPFFRRAKAKADYAAIIAPALFLLHGMTRSCLCKPLPLIISSSFSKLWNGKLYLCLGRIKRMKRVFDYLSFLE